MDGVGADALWEFESKPAEDFGLVGIGAADSTQSELAAVDEGLTLLSGRDAGAPGPDGRFPAGSVNAAVEQALEANAARLKELRE